MADIRTIYKDFAGDWQILAPGLAEDSGLDTAVIISLFSDRRAEDGDLPSGENRRGWWGDTYAEIESDKIGSRLWLLSREKQLPRVVARAEEYVNEALAWLIADGIANRVQVTATVIAQGVLGLDIQIYRNDAPPVRFRFDYFWQGGLNAL